MSDNRPPIPTNRIPLAIGAAAVVVAGIVAIAVGVNTASTAQPAPTPTVAPTPTPTPAPSPIPFADCTKDTFGPALAPLNPPKNVHVYSSVPPMTIDTGKLYEMTIVTKKGDIVFCLQPQLAPNTVNVIVTLARNKFYDGVPFHRVCPSATDTSCGGAPSPGQPSLDIAQGGDPNCIGNVNAASCGSGGPGFKFDDEPVRESYIAGAVAMANSGANSNGSQFFICTGNDAAVLQPSYNLFANVASGLSVAQKLVKGDVMETVTVSEETS